MPELLEPLRGESWNKHKITCFSWRYNCTTCDGFAGIETPAAVSHVILGFASVTELFL